MNKAKSCLEHLHLWQQRNFQDKTSDDQSTDVANFHRNNVAQIHVAINNSNTDEQFANILLDEEAKSYYKVVDETDYTKGLNNYAEKALSITSGFQNQSESWKSELTCNGHILQSIEHKLGGDKHCDDLLLDDATNKATLKLLESNYSKPCAGDFTQASHFSSRQSLQTANVNNQKRIKNDDFLSSHISKFTNGQNETKRKFQATSSDDDMPTSATCFKSAREQLCINQKKKVQRTGTSPQGSKKLLGSRPRNQCYSKFVPPNRDQKEESGSSVVLQKCGSYSSTSGKSDETSDPRLKGVDPQLIELVLSEIMDHGPPIDWDDIAGLEFAKATIKEVVIWPMLRPDIFTGLRGPPKGILLFGPPGTGKTLIGKCIANQSGATFFSISASSLTSKWIGQAEKMVRALFAVANIHQPAVIFIDEIDSLLSQRSDSEHESSRRIKTEFFVQLDGATTSSEDRILVVGATNRPQEIDEAARRRLVKRLYIPLPDDEARKQIIVKLLQQQPYSMTQDDILAVVSQTNGYSGADVTNLCKDAALGPIRSLQVMDISRISKEDVRPININDFKNSLQRVKASVSQKDLIQYQEWNKIFGCGDL